VLGRQFERLVLEVGELVRGEGQTSVVAMV
jgi:hypothetical protein